MLFSPAHVLGLIEISAASSVIGAPAKLACASRRFTAPSRSRLLAGDRGGDEVDHRLRHLEGRVALARGRDAALENAPASAGRTTRLSARASLGPFTSCGPSASPSPCQVIASTQQPGYHMTSHMPHTDKAYIRLGILRSRHYPVPPFPLLARESSNISSDLHYFTPKAYPAYGTEPSNQGMLILARAGFQHFPGVFLSGSFYFQRPMPVSQMGSGFAGSQWLCCSLFGSITRKLFAGRCE